MSREGKEGRGGEVEKGGGGGGAKGEKEKRITGQEQGEGGGRVI